MLHQDLFERKKEKKNTTNHQICKWNWSENFGYFNDWLFRTMNKLPVWCGACLFVCLAVYFPLSFLSLLVRFDFFFVLFCFNLHSCSVAWMLFLRYVKQSTQWSCCACFQYKFSGEHFKVKIFGLLLNLFVIFHHKLDFGFWFGLNLFWGLNFAVSIRCTFGNSSMNSSQLELSSPRGRYIHLHAQGQAGHQNLTYK